ncbi:MAG TPA: GlxA family transcriptional regulator [Terriglobales bacterium]|nr:GlxA family transcriptional regulator [Terriglobales bacterium]
MVTSDTPIEIGIVVYPGAQQAAVLGLTDLFAIADRAAADRAATGEGAAEVPRLRVSHWALKEGQLKDGSDTAMPVSCTEDTHADMPHRPLYLLLPPRLNGLPPAESNAALAPWLRALHAEGTVLGSVCAGAFVLAATGLLDKRAATTHWSYAETFAAQFPQIAVDTDKLIIDDGDIITAGGLMAWTDLGLRIVERLLGATVMLETARILLVDPAGREQRFYSSFAPKLHHGDKAILKVQHWLQGQATRDVTLADMAEQAGLEERTFLRRFHKATGLKPTEYCQHLCVGKAREMLEFSKQSVEQIAWAVGYEDAGAFRKVFQKVMGLSPGDYRRRFGLHM